MGDNQWLTWLNRVPQVKCHWKKKNFKLMKSQQRWCRYIEQRSKNQKIPHTLDVGYSIEHLSAYLNRGTCSSLKSFRTLTSYITLSPRYWCQNVNSDDLMMLCQDIDVIKLKMVKLRFEISIRCTTWQFISTVEIWRDYLNLSHGQVTPHNSVQQAWVRPPPTSTKWKLCCREVFLTDYISFLI